MRLTVNTSNRIARSLLMIFLSLMVTACQQDVPTAQVANDAAATDELGATIVFDSTATESQQSERDGDGNTQWQHLDTTGGGGMTSTAFHPTDPDIVYMAGDIGGLFKTENGGDSWSSISSNLGAYRLGFVTLDPLNPDVIYVTAKTQFGHRTEGGATGEIYRSVNGGLFWEFVSDAMGFQNASPGQVAIVIPYDSLDPSRFDRDGDDLSDVIFVGAWGGAADPPVGGIWKSEDEGKTFTQLTLHDRNITAIRAFAGDVNVLFVTTHESEVYRSEDFGEHWVNIAPNMSWPHLSDLAVHPTEKNILYVTCRYCQTGEPPIWKTTDSGQNWYPASVGLDSNEISGFPNILMDRFDPNTLYVTTDKGPREKVGVYKSTDGGSSWFLMPARLVLPDGRPFFWYRFPKQLTIGQAIDGRLFSGGSGAWRYPDGDSDDGVQEWEPATIGVGNIRVNTIAVDPLDHTVLYQGINDFGPYKSVDHGLSFHRILGNDWPVTVDNYVWNGPYYRKFEECMLPCSSTCAARGRIGSGGTTDFAISKQDSSIIYSAFGSGSGDSERGGVNKSIDGGANWQPVGFQIEAGFELNPETCVPYGFGHLAIDSTNDEIVFAAEEIPPTNIGRLYKTTDGGATWEEVYTTSSAIIDLEVSAVDPDLVVFATSSEVYKSEQAGAPGSWQIINPPDVRGVQVVALSLYRSQVLVIGTNDQGIYYSADGGLSWVQSKFKDLFEQRLYQESEHYLDPEIATAFNPERKMRKNISIVVFDPVMPDVFYAAGTQYTRASFGVIRVTNAGQTWERLSLEGLSNRNVLDLAIDSSGAFLYAGTLNGTYRLKLREG